jgi:L-tyrosine isonitrile synthase
VTQTNPISPDFGQAETSPNDTIAYAYGVRPSKRTAKSADAPGTQGQQPVKVLQSFNTWAFKREQPETIERLLETIARAVETDRPLEFVMYWGKGPRHTIAQPEVQTLDYLESMMARVRATHRPGAKVVLIQTDTHARLNGHRDAHIARYFDEVRTLAHSRKMETTLLSKVVTEARDAGALVGIDDQVPPPDEVLRSLIQSAIKWHFGGLDPEAAARAYFAQNMVERGAVQHVFPHAVFLTYNGSSVRALFPERMPIFYMYALKKGIAVKPWFMAA